jgi:16S rRNA (guanine527-N7)-methyltransferase
VSRDDLDAGARALGLALTGEQRERLLAYRDELARWGRVHNLTAVRDPAEMVPVHLLDSLALCPWLAPGALADVGSGGGLPGIPLAIAEPERAVTLIEPRGKRALFLQRVVRMLALANVGVERRRVEALSALAVFDTVVTRAFGTLRQFADAAGPLCRPGGWLLAAKGRRPATEIAALAPGWMSEVVALQVPGVDAARHAVRMWPPPAGAWGGTEIRRGAVTP